MRKYLISYCAHVIIIGHYGHKRQKKGCAIVHTPFCNKAILYSSMSSKAPPSQEPRRESNSTLSSPGLLP